MKPGSLSGKRHVYLFFVAPLFLASLVNAAVSLVCRVIMT